MTTFHSELHMALRKRISYSCHVKSIT